MENIICFPVFSEFQSCTSSRCSPYWET